MNITNDLDKHLSILTNSSNLQISHDPFPHLIVHNCLPSHLYSQLEAAYPPDDYLQKWQPERTGENVRQKIEFHSIVNHRASWPGCDIWNDFVSTHLSSYFFHQLLNLFSREILTTSPLLESILGCPLDQARISTHIPNKPLSLSDEEKTIFLEGDVGINTPLTSLTSVRGPHVDGMQKIFAGLLILEDNVIRRRVVTLNYQLGGITSHLSSTV